MFTPQFPTDNLYKFLAIGGLSAAVFAVWLAWEQEKTENALAMSTRDEFCELVTGSDELGIEFRVTGPGGMKLTSASAPAFVATAESREGYLKAMDSLDEALKTASNDADRSKADLAKSLRPKLRKYAIDARILWQLSDDNKFEDRLLFRGMVVALSICALGFVLWYLIVQRRLDKLLKLQVADEKAKAAMRPSNEKIHAAEVNR